MVTSNILALSDDGDVIDCVDIYKQPAFDHPLLKNHTLQPSSIQINQLKLGEKDDALKALQGWRKNGECPVGTVPIVRIPTISSKYGPKTSHFQSHYITHPNRSLAIATETTPGHEYAQVSMLGGPFFGTKTNINVWNPDSNGTMSVSQIWVTSSQHEQLNAIEAGWIAGYRHDPRTRFFIYWTSDGYRSTGCYNLHCPGFVQVSKKIALGALLRPLSTYNGKQKIITIVIDQHTENGEWWLKYGNNPIGYWPNSLFKTLGVNGAEMLSWGGEIINNGADGHHSSTQMGSGHFPDEGFGKASYFSNIQYIDASKLYKDPEKLTPYATKPSCYDVKVADDKSGALGTHFFYGGPGYSDKCPT
ncbi:hypothetical protein CsatA_020964 [Cannabis sativa]